MRRSRLSTGEVLDRSGCRATLAATLLPTFGRLSATTVRPEGAHPLGMEAVAERMAHHLVSHHPGMPCAGQAQQTVGTARGFVHRLHLPTTARRVATSEPPMSRRPNTTSQS